jgi:predicted ester cyclase
MAEAENLALYRRLIEEGVGIGRLDVLDEILAPSIELPTVAPMAEPTIAGLKQLNEGLRAGMPDATAEVEEIFASGDGVGARLRWTGTHTGEFLGLAPTGRRFAITEIEIVKCENGRIVDLRNVFDISGLMAQLTG